MRTEKWQDMTMDERKVESMNFVTGIARMVTMNVE